MRRKSAEQSQNGKRGGQASVCLTEVDERDRTLRQLPRILETSAVQTVADLDIWTRCSHTPYGVISNTDPKV